MTAHILTRAWILLVGLSLIAAAVSLGLPTRLAAPAILLLALLKARIILSDYLDLKSAPPWQRGFTLTLTLFCLTLLGLYLAA
ncbi:cytochrome C oxidase subunit IV family protein [Roseobacter sp.]|uniref:cytochrome C oxidase subunit IV family protein n=1 Tax=Roseobacter sp. TaxID=1907202 RepID=UPI0032977BE6